MDSCLPKKGEQLFTVQSVDVNGYINKTVVVSYRYTGLHHGNLHHSDPTHTESQTTLYLWNNIQVVNMGPGT